MSTSIRRTATFSEMDTTMRSLGTLNRDITTNIDE